MPARPPLRIALLATLAALAVAAPAAADLGTRKHAVDDQIAGLRDRAAAAKAREQQLATQIDAVTGKIRSLEAQTLDVSARLATLQSDLRLQKARLEKIQALYRLQTHQLRFFKHEFGLAVRRLEERMVQIYESGQPSTVEVLVSARSLSQMIDQIDYMNRVAAQDRALVATVGSARHRVRLARVRTIGARRSLAAQTRVIAYRARQLTAVRNRLLISRRSLVSARNTRTQELAQTRAQERDWTREAATLSAVSSQLAAQIQAAQAASSSSPPSGSQPNSSGLIWPVHGPITSPFGMRWGKLHPGIDIGASMGTPIQAAAAGRVIVAAYDGGYGNLVVIDHGNGLATAYAHQSRLAVSVGQQVAQGHVIGYVGSTGYSTGPHLHFEVRVNGNPVDPLGYL